MKMKSSSSSVRYATDAKDDRTMEMMRDSDFQKRARRKMRRRRKVVRAPEKALVVLGTMSAWCMVIQLQQTATRHQEVLGDCLKHNWIRDNVCVVWHIPYTHTGQPA
jgi:hypothetical protein